MREAFMKYMNDGGGCVFIHAANNAFSGWTEYDQMIGLGWRDAKYGYGVVIDPENNRMIRVPIGKGRGAGHGRKHPFAVTTRTPHPITRGLPKVWLHGFDELYQGQRGPAADMTVILSSFADPRTGGSGEHVPMVWTIPVGKGRSVVCLMGHHWRKQARTDALRCIGYETIVERSTEWAATGAVTLPKPARFPTATKTEFFDSTAHLPIETPSPGIRFRVACVGDSITFGSGIKDRSTNCWPSVLGRKLGPPFDVGNFGVSGATLLSKSSQPYVGQQAWKDSLAYDPHAVILMLGTNDTKVGDKLNADAIEADLSAFIDTYRALKTSPRVFLVLPPPIFATRWGINEKTLTEIVIPAIRKVGRARNCAVIDLHARMKGSDSLFPDSVHPNATGAARMAAILHGRVF
jgi:lysophospholipase L1-like esterase